MRLLNFLILSLFLVYSDKLYSGTFSEVSELDQNLWSTYLHADRFGADGLLFLGSNTKSSTGKNEFVQLSISSDSKDFSKPLFLISSSKLINGNKEINLDPFVLDLKNKFRTERSHEMKNFPEYDFIKIAPTSGSVAVAFDAFEDNVLFLTYKKQRLHLKIPPENYNYFKDSFSFSHLFGEKSKQIDLDIQINKLPALKLLIEKLRTCVKRKDVDCMLEHVYVNKSSFTEEKVAVMFRKNFLRRFVFDDLKTCEVYQSTRSMDFEGDNHIPNGLELKVDKSKSKVWDSLEKALSFDLNYNYVNLQSNHFQDGINSIIVFKKLRKDLACTSSVDTHFYLKKYNNVWKIEGLELSSDSDTYL